MDYRTHRGGLDQASALLINDAKPLLNITNRGGGKKAINLLMKSFKVEQHESDSYCKSMHFRVCKKKYVPYHLQNIDPIPVPL